MAVVRRKKSQTEETWLIAYADLITNLLIFFVALLSVANISEAMKQEMASSLSGETKPSNLRSIKSELDKSIDGNGYAEVLSTEMTKDGLKLSINSGVIFQSGNAEIEEQWKPIITETMDSVKPFIDRYQIAIEGHTDKQPIAKGGLYPSNWELGSARAHSIRSQLELSGFPSNRLHTESYADTVPLEKEKIDKIESRSERMARHRRVVIRVF